MYSLTFTIKFFVLPVTFKIRQYADVATTTTM